MFEEEKLFTQMFDVEKTPFVDDGDLYVYFEPVPTERLDDNSLEGCLYHAAKIESLVDKNNLYLCE